MHTPDAEDSPGSAPSRTQPESHQGYRARGVHMLLVEDNEDDVFFTRRAFNTVAPEVTIDAVSKGEDAIIRAATGTYDVALVDYKLPDMDGMEVLVRIAGLNLPVIMATGVGDQRTAVQALKSGAEDYVVKEEGYLRHLPQTVLGVIKRNRLDRENRRLLAETARQATLLEAVLETDPGAIAVLHGPRLLLQVANPSFRALSPALQEANIMGQTLDNLLATAGMAIDFNAELERAFNTRQAAHFLNIPIAFPEAENKYFHVHILPLNPDAPDEERDIALILWDTTREVEARQRAERLAREAEAQRAWLQTVVDQMPEGVHIAEAPGAKMLLSNRAADEILGRPLMEEISSQDLPETYGLSRVDGTPIKVEELPLQRAVWNEEVVSGEELLLKREDGEELTLLMNAAPLYDPDGRHVAGSVVFQDITRIKENERLMEEIAEQAEAQRAWLQIVVDQMPSGVYIVSAPDGRLLFTNAAANELFGPPPVTHITDRNTVKLFRTTHPDGTEIESEKTGFMQVLATGQPVSGRQIRHVKPDGTVVDILSNTAPLFDTRGNMIAAVSVFQDITQLKQVERIKDDFISIASHELRTPLTSLKAAGQLLIRRAKQHSYAERDINLINTVIQQADRMNRLIEELLDVSQIQSGNLQLRPEIFDLSGLAAEVNEMSGLSHPGYRHSLVAREPVWVDADRDRIAQVLTNLIDNAIKYNKGEGLVEVSVEAIRSARTAEIRVRDNGIGFAPDQSERIFERFARLGTVANHSRGMGLGLFICRQIIEAHGGTISARSEGPGQGAIITVRLPLASGPQE